MSHLFACSIGPVQDFIATARRSRDLWYGSWLLSELSKAAAKAIADNGGQLIFPAFSKPDDLKPMSSLSAPNKIMAVMNGVPDIMANAVNDAINTRLYGLRDDAFEQLRGMGAFQMNSAQAQVDDLVEYYWTSVEIHGDDGYRRARGMAETLLAARKATRDFSSSKGDYRPKSSLDGARESVINENVYPSLSDSAAEIERKSKLLFDRFGARPAERLSGVDIMKRLGQRGSRAASFPSTSHMASYPFLVHVDKNKRTGDSQALCNAIRDYLETQNVPIDETDGALVYSSRLADWVSDKTKRERPDKVIDKLLSDYAGDVRPQPYYALLVADGDNMGAAIDHLTAQTNPQQEHRNLSLALGQFASQVEEIVSAHQGALVYSGGDDVMAYLPLHTALQCVGVLADSFAASMEQFKTLQGVSPTLSSGIVVAHHLEPLSETLSLARQAENSAKTVVGKHGLAITVSKRSGVDRTIKGKRVELSKRLMQMIEWQQSGAISAGVAYELYELHLALGRSLLPEKALADEAVRIVDRKHESGGASKVSEQVAGDLVNWIRVEKLKLSELAHEMIIASMFADAMTMAKGEFPKEAETK